MTVRYAKKIADALVVLIERETRLMISGSVVNLDLRANSHRLIAKIHQMGLMPKDVDGATGLDALAAIARTVCTSTASFSRATGLNAEWMLILRLVDAQFGYTAEIASL